MRLYGEEAAVERGGIYWVDIPYHTGNEIAKRRPAVVLSVDSYNQKNLTATVAFCSSAVQWNDLPTHVDVYMDSKPTTKVLCEHIYTVDVSRIDCMIRWASAEEMRRVERAVMEYLGLSEAVEERTSPDACPQDKAATMEELIKIDKLKDEIVAEQRGEIRALERLVERLMAGKC